MTLLIRVNGEPASAAAAVRSLIRELDTDVPVTNVVALSDRVSETVATRRYTASLVTLFASFALVLSCVGIYGVLAYAVSRRRREMGVRVALGARPADVLRLVLREGFVIAATGIAIGLAGALALTRVLASMLYDTHATDPLTLAGVCVLVTVSALLASWLPARRAAAIDPLRALTN
jgi:putative ABC transport system permease protein